MNVLLNFFPYEIFTYSTFSTKMFGYKIMFNTANWIFYEEQLCATNLSYLKKKKTFSKSSNIEKNIVVSEKFESDMITNKPYRSIQRLNYNSLDDTKLSWYKEKQMRAREELKNRTKFGKVRTI